MIKGCLVEWLVFACYFSFINFLSHFLLAYLNQWLGLSDWLSQLLRLSFTGLGVFLLTNYQSRRPQK